jgi:RNA polymerase sigma factor (sigma-70 family)
MRKPFEQVVADYGGVVLRVCGAVLGPVDAEDAWSETFLSALQAYPHLPPGANVRAWLITIAHRKAIDVTRARSRRPAPVEQVPDSPATWGQPEPADSDLWTALAALPDRQRATVAYHYLAGLPYQQVAEIIGGTADAARRAASDGIRALRTGYRPATTQETPTR